VIKEAHRKFLTRNLSALAWPIFILGFGCVNALFFLQPDSREEIVRLRGAIASLEIVSNTPDRGAVFVFTVKERTTRFKIAGLSDVDQALLGLEIRGNVLEFGVEKKLLENDSGAPIPVVELSSEKNVYIRADQLAEVIRKGRMASGFLALVAILITVWLLVRMRQLYLRELKHPPAEEYDWLIVFVARKPKATAIFVDVLLVIPALILSPRTLPVLGSAVVAYLLFALWFKLRGDKVAWIKTVLESERLRESNRPARPATSAPKHVKAVEILLKSGHGVDMQNKAGQTALHIAATVGSIEAAQLLLSKGAKVDLVDGKGQTALMISAAKGQLGFVSKLLESGADVLYANDQGQTALDLAKKNERNVATIDLLTKAVAKAEAARKAKAEEEARKAAEAAAKGEGTPPAQGAGGTS
jgi:Ca2+/Na+ antiporter